MYNKHYISENIALEKSSRHIDNKKPAYFSFLANDRDVNTCSFTAGPEKQRRSDAPWWAVWFPENVTFKEFVFTTKNKYLSKYI